MTATEVRRFLHPAEDQVRIYLTGLDGGRLHAWPFDRAELGDRAAEALASEARLGAADELRLLVWAWEALAELRAS